jgi:hypothetical protein
MTAAVGPAIIGVVARRRSFDLIYDPEVIGHLRAIDSKYHSLIRATVERQLAIEPETETRNRKPLKRPVAFGAQWELRFGPNKPLPGVLQSGG